MRSAIAAVALLVICHGAMASAQDKPAPEPAPGTQSPAAKPSRTPLKVTVVLTRYQGEKRISSMPYVLGVLASSRMFGPPQKTTLRMGSKVPVAQQAVGGDAKGPFTTYNYTDVGTNIDCAASYEEGATVFALGLTISDSSVVLEPRKDANLDPLPSFRNFNSSFTALLRDGQSTQYTSATDPVTGEVMKIDVTLALMK